MSDSFKSKVGTQDWFYHAPSQLKEKDLHDLNDIHAMSQIPGLSQQDEYDPNELDSTNRRKWIRDTDTDYIKLAKSGGRKDILRYKNAQRPASPVPYPRVDWFDDQDFSDEKPNPTSRSFEAPEWYGHEEHINFNDDTVNNNTGRPLLGYDALTTWKRSENSSGNKKGRNRKSKSAPERKEHLKLPPIVQKKSLDCDIASLLSFKYQSDFLNEMNEKNIARRKELLDERQEAKEKLKKERDLFKTKKKTSDNHETQKPLFKLSRFDNVSSKVVTYR